MSTAAKVVVVLGSGPFGISLANRLAKKRDHKVKLITLSRFGYLLVASPRVAITNNTDRTIFPLDSVLQKNVEVIVGDTTDITEDQITLKSDKSSSQIPFDALVIATGAKWSDPLGSTDKFRDDFANYFAKQHEKLEQAKHIVLLGGGFNNVELAGELNHHFEKELETGEKKITLVHSSATLLPNNGFYGEALKTRVTETIQKDTHVEVLLNSRGQISETNPNEIIINNDPSNTVKGDLIIRGIGVNPSVPPNHIANLVDDAGFIKIETNFKISALPQGKIFAIGDVTNFAFRGLFMRGRWLSTITQNIDTFLKDPNAKLANVKRPKQEEVPTIVSIGPTRGDGQLPLPFFGTVRLPEWMVVYKKSKDMGREMVNHLYNS